MRILTLDELQQVSGAGKRRYPKPKKCKGGKGSSSKGGGSKGGKGSRGGRKGGGSGSK